MSPKPDPYLPRILAALPPPPATLLRSELQQRTGISERVMARRLKTLQLMGLVQTVGRIHWQATGELLEPPPQPPQYRFQSVLAPGAPWPYGARP